MNSIPSRPLTYNDQPHLEQSRPYMESLICDVEEAGYAIASYRGAPDIGLYTTAFTIGRTTELIVFGLLPEVGSSLLRDLCSYHSDDLAHSSEIESMIACGDQIESVALRQIAPVALMAYAPILSAVRSICGLSRAPIGALQVVMKDEFGVWAITETSYQPDLSPRPL